MSLYPSWIANRLKGQAVHIVASGPSLKGFDYSYFDDKKTIAINHSYKKLKNPLWTMAVDQDFIRIEDPEAPRRTNLIARALAQYPEIIDYEPAYSFSLNPNDGVYRKKDSGCSALTTALQAGAERVYLWGFDYCISPDLYHATDDEFSHRWKKSNALDKQPLLKFGALMAEKIPYFQSFPVDKIFNLSPVSAIPYFKKISLSEVINGR